MNLLVEFHADSEMRKQQHPKPQPPPGFRLYLLFRCCSAKHFYRWAKPRAGHSLCNGWRGDVSRLITSLTGFLKQVGMATFRLTLDSLERPPRSWPAPMTEASAFISRRRLKALPCVVAQPASCCESHQALEWAEA